MAGILTRIGGYNTAPSLPQAKEASGVQLETEYSYFLLLSDQQLADLMAKYENNDFQIFMEGKLPGSDAARPRIRQVLDSKGTFVSASLETKIPEGDSKREYPDPICQVNFRSLCGSCESITTRIRIVIPVISQDGPYVKSDGSALAWEADLFFNPIFDGSINNWIKLELEVDRLSMQDMDLAKAIPFEYERLIVSKSHEAEDRTIIGNLFSHGYNLMTNADINYADLPAIKLSSSVA